MARAYLALGANLGDPLGQLRRAVEALALLPGTRVTAASGVYETDPWGVADQPVFLNAALALETTLSPHALLGACLGIEAAMGRVRRLPNGPRVLDLDLLLNEGAECRTPELTLPHPRMWERAFVLAPLADIYPPAAEALAGLDRSGVRSTGYTLPLPEGSGDGL